MSQTQTRIAHLISYSSPQNLDPLLSMCRYICVFPKREDTRQDIILHSIPQKVTTEMNTWLTCPLAIIEIWEALSDLDADN